jgi:hypothetical protein
MDILPMFACTKVPLADMRGSRWKPVLVGAQTMERPSKTAKALSINKPIVVTPRRMSCTRGIPRFHSLTICDR